MRPNSRDPSSVSSADAALRIGTGEDGHGVAIFAGLTSEETCLLEASQWATRILDAIAEDRFVLHLQPIVQLADASVASHEVLIRMRDRNGTIVPPGAFIPAAERFNLASALDEWVVYAVLRALATYDHLNVCVNLFARSLGD